MPKASWRHGGQPRARNHGRGPHPPIVSGERDTAANRRPGRVYTWTLSAA